MRPAERLVHGILIGQVAPLDGDAADFHQCGNGIETFAVKGPAAEVLIGGGTAHQITTRRAKLAVKGMAKHHGEQRFLGFFHLPLADDSVEPLENAVLAVLADEQIHHGPAAGGRKDQGKKRDPLHGFSMENTESPVKMPVMWIFLNPPVA